MNDDNFNPDSFNAQMAKILQILENQNVLMRLKNDRDREDFKSVMEKQDATNGRVTGLEKREQYSLGKIAGVSTAVSLGVMFLGLIIKAIFGGH